MFTPLILFLGLTVATAVIAYWSDNLGKKLGKKRVSLFGLRPRTTATVLTITSSWAIMLFTLAVLLIVVAPLRNALFRYDAERAQYRSDIGIAQQQLATRQEKLSATQSSLSSATKQLSVNANQLRQANVELREANTNIKAARSQALSAAAGAKAAQSRAQQAQRREAQARSGERQAEQLKRSAELALQTSRLSLRQIQARFDVTQGHLSQAQARLANANVRLTSIEGKLKNANASVSGARRLFKRLGREYLDLQRQRDELQKQVSDLASAAQFYRDAALHLAGGDVKITVGRAFASRIIGARQKPEAIETILREIFEQGQSGFQYSEDTAPLYAHGARLQLLSLSEKTGNDTVLIEGDQIYQRLARDISNQDEPTSIRLVAVGNFTAEEKIIAVRFVAVPVAVAFRSGETIATALIDGALGDAVIFNNLLNLTEEGRREAVKRKVDPPQSPYEPNFYAVGTNVSLFGALRRIEATKRLVRVNLVAAEELSTVEPLRVRFEIEDSPNDS